MKIALANNLIELAKGFKDKGSTLYVVGGYVRNALLGRFDTDTDLAGPLVMEEVEDVARTLGWRFQVVNKKLGTILLSKNKDHYEYSCFRSENYNIGGEHTPSSVDFVTDIRVDAARRDFTVNALYYDILEDNILDFNNGIQDLNEHKLVAIGSPQRVFSSDGLRVLRMIRQAGDLGFNVDKKTFKTATEMAYQLKDISKERILYELVRISCSDYVKIAIKLMNKSKMWRYITNLPTSFKLPTKKMIDAVEKAPLEWTFEFFICAIIFKKLKGNLNGFNNLSFHIDQIIGNGGLKASKKICSKVRELYHLIYIFLKNNAPLTAAQKYYMLRDDLKSSFIALDDKKEFLLSSFIDSCIKQKIPLGVEQLNINSDTLLKQEIPAKHITAIKQILVYNCMNGNLKNEEEDLIKGAKKANHYLNQVLKNKQSSY